jgi:hypothetical protein
VELVRIQIDAAVGRPGWSDDAAASGFRGEAAPSGVPRRGDRRRGGAAPRPRRGAAGAARRCQGGAARRRRRRAGSCEAAAGWIWRGGGGMDLAQLRRGGSGVGGILKRARVLGGRPAFIFWPDWTAC